LSYQDQSEEGEEFGCIMLEADHEIKDDLIHRKHETVKIGDLKERTENIRGTGISSVNNFASLRLIKNAVTPTTPSPLSRSNT